MQRVVLSLAAVCALAFAPAFAADEAPVTDTKPAVHQGWGFRVGFLQGHEVAKGPPDQPVLLGLQTTPTLKDSGLLGAFYFNDPSPNVRVELGLSLAPTKIDHVCPDADNTAPDPGASCAEHEGSADALLVYWDVLVMPHWKWGKTHIGVPLGLGWSNTRASKPFAPEGLVNGRNVSVDLSAAAGMTYFIGVRPYWDIGKDRSLFLQVRAMRFHRIVNVSATTLKSLEVSVGMSFGLKSK